jgi:hypothetical protein
MKKKLIYLLIFSVISCSTKKDTKSLTLLPIKSLEDTTFFSGNLKGSPDSLFPIYMSSVNKFKPGMSIPSFFYNPLLDYENPWIADHHTWSLRKMIFDSTENISLLNVIIKSNDFRLKQIVDSNSVDDKLLLNAIPYSKISNYEMARQRLQNLNKVK